jgi:DNA-directed RNA polymerase specialized sigma24 family protein
MKKENCPVTSQQEKYFLNTFPLINQIVLSKTAIIPSRFIDDLIQQVRFKLWRWKQNQAGEKDLSFEEWQKLANVAAHNEITDYYRRRENQNLLFSEVSEVETDFEKKPFQSPEVEGESEYESITLLLLIWDKFQKLSLRQKYAFLFHKDEFVGFLLKYGCCSPQELAATLALSEAEFVLLLGRLPLADTDIQNLLINKLGEKLTVEQVWVARSKAKANLLKSLKG